MKKKNNNYKKKHNFKRIKIFKILNKILIKIILITSKIKLKKTKEYKITNQNIKKKIFNMYILLR